MAWFILVAAGLLEIGWAIGLKHTQGFTRLGPSLLTAGAMLASVALLGVAEVPSTRKPATTTAPLKRIALPVPRIDSTTPWVTVIPAARWRWKRDIKWIE